MKKALLVVGILVVAALVYWGSTSKETATGTIKNVTTAKLPDSTRTVVLLEAAGAEAKNLTFCGSVGNRIPGEGTVVEFGFSPKKGSDGTVECNNLERIRVIK
jgi:hypothetical protein